MPIVTKRIKKRGGGTRLARVEILASGKWKFHKNLKKGRSTRRNPKKKKTRRSSNPKKGGNRRMGRKLKIPLALVGGLAAGLAQPLASVMAGDFPSALDKVAFHYAGIAGVNTGNPHFTFEGLKVGILPLVVGALIHKFVGGAPLNLNRSIAAAGIPFISI